jgi:two-component system invasion response regulator UvrY
MRAKSERETVNGESNSLKILIADQNAIMRFGMAELLKKNSAAVVSEVDSPERLMSAAMATSWGLIILDLCFSGSERLDVLQYLIDLRKDLRVLVVASRPEPEFGVRAMRIGARGYLSKGEPVEEFHAAVNSILHNQKYISASLAKALLASVFAAGSSHGRLSHREYQVMIAVASGKRVKEIAADLRLSVKTISTFRIRTLSKLGIADNAGLTRYALQAGLL